MSDDHELELGHRFIGYQKFWDAGVDLLTGAQAVRRTSYTVAQFHLLVRHHGFPLPVEELEPRSVLWRSDEIDEWRKLRDARLANILG